MTKYPEEQVAVFFDGFHEDGTLKTHSYTIDGDAGSGKSVQGFSVEFPMQKAIRKGYWKTVHTVHGPKQVFVQPGQIKALVHQHILKNEGHPTPLHDLQALHGGGTEANDAVHALSKEGKIKIDPDTGYQPKGVGGHHLPAYMGLAAEASPGGMSPGELFAAADIHPHVGQSHLETALKEGHVVEHQGKLYHPFHAPDQQAPPPFHAAPALSHGAQAIAAVFASNAVKQHNNKAATNFLLQEFPGTGTEFKLAIKDAVAAGIIKHVGTNSAGSDMYQSTGVATPAAPVKPPPSEPTKAEKLAAMVSHGEKLLQTHGKTDVGALQTGPHPELAFDTMDALKVKHGIQATGDTVGGYHVFAKPPAPAAPTEAEKLQAMLERAEKLLGTHGEVNVGALLKFGGTDEVQLAYDAMDALKAKHGLVANPWMVDGYTVFSKPKPEPAQSQAPAVTLEPPVKAPANAFANLSKPAHAQAAYDHLQALGPMSAPKLGKLVWPDKKGGWPAEQGLKLLKEMAANGLVVTSAKPNHWQAVDLKLAHPEATPVSAPKPTPQELVKELQAHGKLLAAATEPEAKPKAQHAQTVVAAIQQLGGGPAGSMEISGAMGLDYDDAWDAIDVALQAKQIHWVHGGYVVGPDPEAAHEPDPELDEYQHLLLFAMHTDGGIHSSQAKTLLGGHYHGGNLVELKGLGLVTSKAGGQWTLTPAGEQAVANGPYGKSKQETPAVTFATPSAPNFLHLKKPEKAQEAWQYLQAHGKASAPKLGAALWPDKKGGHPAEMALKLLKEMGEHGYVAKEGTAWALTAPTEAPAAIPAPAPPPPAAKIAGPDIAYGAMGTGTEHLTPKITLQALAAAEAHGWQWYGKIETIKGIKEAIPNVGLWGTKTLSDTLQDQGFLIVGTPGGAYTQVTGKGKAFLAQEQAAGVNWSNSPVAPEPLTAEGLLAKLQPGKVYNLNDFKALGDDLLQLANKLYHDKKIEVSGSGYQLTTQAAPEVVLATPPAPAAIDYSFSKTPEVTKKVHETLTALGKTSLQKLGMAVWPEFDKGPTNTTPADKANAFTRAKKHCELLQAAGLVQQDPNKASQWEAVVPAAASGKAALAAATLQEAAPKATHLTAVEALQALGGGPASTPQVAAKMHADYSEAWKQLQAAEVANLVHINSGPGAGWILGPKPATKEILPVGTSGATQAQALQALQLFAAGSTYNEVKQALGIGLHAATLANALEDHGYFDNGPEGHGYHITDQGKAYLQSQGLAVPSAPEPTAPANPYAVEFPAGPYTAEELDPKGPKNILAKACWDILKAEGEVSTLGMAEKIQFQAGTWLPLAKKRKLVKGALEYLEGLGKIAKNSDYDWEVVPGATYKPQIKKPSAEAHAVVTGQANAGPAPTALPSVTDVPGVTLEHIQGFMTPEEKAPLILGTMTYTAPKPGGTVIGSGSGVYKAEDGKKYVVKHAFGEGSSNPFKYWKSDPGDEHARSEVLATKLALVAGVPAPDNKLVDLTSAGFPGKWGIGSEWINITPGKMHDAEWKKIAQQQFAVHAWLGNWDVVGASQDNMVTGTDGLPLCIDWGGSLLFRAQGKKKWLDGEASFGPKVAEWDTYTNPGVDGYALFGGMTAQQKVDSAKKVAAISDEVIRALVDEWGPSDPAEREKVYGILVARKKDIIKRADAELNAEAMQKAQAAAEAKQLANMGAVISNPWKNVPASIEAVSAAFKTAGNAVIKVLQKASGYHQQWGYYVHLNDPTANNEQAEAKAKTKQLVADTIGVDLDTFNPNSSPFHAASGYGIYNDSNPAYKVPPPSGSKVHLYSTDKTKKQAHKEFNAIETHLQVALNSYTGGGYTGQNASLRKGTPATNAQQAASAYKLLAKELPPGAYVERGLSLGQEILGTLKNNIGVVIQEPGFSSSSPTKPWPGDTTLCIYAAPGAKAVNVKSYSSSGESEDEVLYGPNQRFLVFAVGHGKDVKNQTKTLVHCLALPPEDWKE